MDIEFLFLGQKMDIEFHLAYMPVWHVFETGPNCVSSNGESNEIKFWA